MLPLSTWFETKQSWRKPEYHQHVKNHSDQHGALYILAFSCLIWSLLYVIKYTNDLILYIVFDIAAWVLFRCSNVVRKYMQEWATSYIVPVEIMAIQMYAFDRRLSV